MLHPAGTVTNDEFYNTDIMKELKIDDTGINDNFGLACYAPNFEKVGSILVSACASLRQCVHSLEISSRNFMYGFLILHIFLGELSPLVKLQPFEKSG